MSNIVGLFGHPVLTVDDYPGAAGIAEAFRRRALALMDEFPDAGLVSDAFHRGGRAASREDFARHGFTSFYNVNLGKREDFHFVNRAAMDVFAHYLRAVGRTGLGMRMDNAWASIYGRGHFVPQHTHPLSHLSLVFYAAATPGTGHLVFDNPARAHFEHFYPPELSWLQPRASVEPRAGLFVVFPSYLVHHTEPHQSDEPRIIYSANVQLRFRKPTASDRDGESTQSRLYREL